MALTQAQELAATTLTSPLFIQAGAGTGKTHTLTQRLVYAFSPDSGEEGGPLLEHADQFVTITFTNKAAGELLGRIRAALRSNGLDEAALEIDSAWVSTIHGMCKRILVEHALTTGIDTSVGLLDETQQQYYLACCLDRFFEAHVEDSRLKELLDDYGDSNTTSIIRKLVNAANAQKEGLSQIDLGPQVLANPSDASPLRMSFRTGVEGALDATREVIKQSGAGTQINKFVAYGESLLDELGTEDKGLASAYAIACSIVPPSVSNKTMQDIVDEFREVAASFVRDTMLAKQRVDLESFLGYAGEVAADFRDFKARHSLLDNDELLQRALLLLKNNPDIAQAYQDHFKLVMIDEFQDTDRVQVGIAEHLVPNDLRSLATVGDKQQSIYRFRGADVAVYSEQYTKMMAQEGVSVSLDSNFRSHDEILRCVDTIFGQESVFSDELLKLKHGRKEGAPYLPQGEPRIRLLMAASSVIDGERSNTKPSNLRRDKARMIAQQFAELRDVHGCKASDMVVLLRKMTDSDLYLDALREQGFGVQVTGGSVFYKTYEVNVLINYMRALSNPYDSPAVIAALRSPLFNLSDDELLLVAGENEPYEGLLAAHEPSIEAAAERFCLALAQSEQMPLSELLRKEIERSGWGTALCEQGVEGSAILANIEKLINLVAEFELQEGIDRVKVSAHFDDLLKQIEKGTSLKEGLGVLQEDTSNAVRIMTIHSAKGLEFPVVAVAEFEDSAPKEQLLYVAQDNKALYPSLKVHPVSLGQSKKDVWGKYYRSRLKDLSHAVAEPSEAATAGALYSFIRKDAAAQEEAEVKRLFYVACTRARDVLLIATHEEALPQLTDEPPRLHEKVLGDIETAFFGHDGFPEDASSFTSQFEFGNKDVRYKGLYQFNVHQDEDEGGLCADELESSSAEHGSLKMCADGSLASNFPKIGAGALVAPVVDLSSAQGITVSSSPAPHPLRLQSYSSLAAAHKMQQSGEGIAHESSLSNVDDAALADEPEAVRDLCVLSGATPLSATDFGSAFHLAAERWLLSEGSSPSQESERAAQLYGLGSDGEIRLRQALERWCDSERARKLREYPTRYAEYPFVVSVEGSVPLQGAIDALGLDFTQKRALICDYKTGTSGEGDIEALQERYLLQASCYAYAILKGFDDSKIADVELAFVRPESSQKESLSEITYRFSREDLTMLQDAIIGKAWA